MAQRLMHGRHALAGLCVITLAACTAPGPAPVSDRSTARSASEDTTRSPQITPSTNGLHTVQRGDTLYAIAFANNLDHREVAIWNQLESPDLILVGQVLRLTPQPGAVEVQPLEEVAAPTAQPLEDVPELTAPQGVLLPYSDANWAQVTASPSLAAVPAPAPASVVPAAPKPVESKPVAALPTAALPTSIDSWLWPAQGTLAGRFGVAGGKGIDIVGVRNAPVVAVAPGKVVYSGSGLRGYGRLLIVKHPGEYLSAYAHNESILVKEGDIVAAGQTVARMGDSGSERVKLHFEIRRYGKPLDPLTYLPERS
jgi:lipoprotein NlpD